MSLHWYETQRHLGDVYVTRQSGGMPHLKRNQALVQIVAAGVCGTDVRVMNGNKKIAGNPQHYIIPGHEGVGRIVAVRDSRMELKPGDYVVVLPHVHKNMPCSAAEITPTCIGNGHTLHRGWDLDGCFADFVVVSTASLKRIAPEHLMLAKKLAPDLGSAVFALVEPMLCVLSAYVFMEEQGKQLLGREFASGRALVIGNGPIGVLHGLALLLRGYSVWFLDTLQKRAELAQWLLAGHSHVFNEERDGGDFDVVMVTASSAGAIRKAETLVRDSGIVYLFAGLNTLDRSTMDPANVFFYENLHRTAKGILTTVPLAHGYKNIFYLGHSGYYESLTAKTIAVAAEYAATLDKMITGVIPGWSSSCIKSRLPGGVDWEVEDGSPAIVSVLRGVDLRERHCKLLIHPRSC
jgi:threonine dehydrogenase-like Zn-dependent dehydrogenase